MCVTRALTIKRGRQFLMITIGMAALTGCGYFADNWEVTGNKCQALSSEENATAVVARENVVFINMESGCAPRLDEFGTRFTDIDIDGHRYPATLLCNRATNNHTFTIVGTPMGQGEQSAQALSVKAIKAFTGFMGAKVTIEGQSSHFSKGNFTQACRAFLPHRTEQRPTASAVADNKPSLTLDDLNQQYKASHPPEPVTAKPTTRPEYAPDVAPTVPEPVALTADIYAQALARAKSTWLMSHPKGKADEHVWVRIRQPDKTLNDEVVRVIRYTTTQPDTGVISDVDVEISPDGSVGYALSKDRVSPTPSVSSTPSTPVQVPPPSTVTNPINAFCTLDNGKHVSVYAADGQDYRYRYTDKNDKTELELKEGLFGVKAFHYYTQLGMGSARYIRFNKGAYSSRRKAPMNGFYKRNGIRHDNVSEDDRAQHINKETCMKKLSMLIVISVLISGPALAQVDAATVQTATQTAQKAYEAVTGNDARDVDWSTFEVIPGMKDPVKPGHKLRVLQWEGFNPGYHTYDRVRVLVNEGGSTVGAEVLYMGR